jgi:hypothetical protein
MLIMVDTYKLAAFYGGTMIATQILGRSFTQADLLLAKSDIQEEFEAKFGRDAMGAKLKYMVKKS